MSARRTKRAALLETLGVEFARLQEASNTFDEAAAAALVIERADLAILTALLFRGALSLAELAASTAQCVGCHGGTASGVLGFSAVQLPARGDGVAIGLAELAAAGRFTTPVPTVEPPGDATTRAALGYLHANCSHCHNQTRPPRDGPRCFDPERAFDFMLRTTELATPAATATYRTAIGAVIAAGDPEASAIVERARSRSEWWGMPALGTEVVDAQGVALLVAWIDAL